MSVSIVIPVFNRAHLVSRAIESALDQTIPCEVLLVDHGSTDDIRSVVRRYEGRIRYIRRDVDQGPILAWREGVEQATGDFLHITYDDDWIQPTFVERCIAAFRSDVALVYTRAQLHTLAGTPGAEINRHPSGSRPISELVHFLLRSPLTISPGCAMFRRQDALKNLLLEVPGAEGRYGKNSGVGEDLLLFLLTSLDYSRYAHVPEVLADFLAHPDSITTDAQLTGKEHSLVEAYQKAKNYYLQRPGAVSLPTLRQGLFHRIHWRIASSFSWVGEIPAGSTQAGP